MKKIFPYIIIVIVSIAIIASFFIIDSPATARARKLDETRVQDLSMIQNEIINFWQKKQVLPATLSLLEDNISGFRVPQDPQTNEEYGYRTMTDLSFELCVTFMASSKEYKENNITKPIMRPMLGSYVNWDHEAGKTCFLRTIDKKLYEVKKDLY